MSDKESNADREKNRISRVTTRTGDGGESGLADGSRHAKDDDVFEAIGSIDELNSVIGMLIAELPADAPEVESLTWLQHRMFDLGGCLAVPGAPFPEENTTALDETSKALNKELPPLKEFVLPGGGRTGAVAHLARTVARRTERRMVTLSRTSQHSNEVIDYSPMISFLNRASDISVYRCAQARPPR